MNKNHELLNFMREFSQIKIEILNLRKSNHSLNHSVNELRHDNNIIRKENKKLQSDIREIKIKHNEIINTNMLVFQELNRDFKNICNFHNEKLHSNMATIINDMDITNAITVEEFMKQR